MADEAKPGLDAQPSSKKPEPAKPEPPRQRETAEERRDKRTAAALATQVDLKREAAERRERKKDS